MMFGLCTLCDQNEESCWPGIMCACARSNAPAPFHWHKIQLLGTMRDDCETSQLSTF